MENLMSAFHQKRYFGFYQLKNYYNAGNLLILEKENIKNESLVIKQNEINGIELKPNQSLEDCKIENNFNSMIKKSLNFNKIKQSPIDLQKYKDHILKTKRSLNSKTEKNSMIDNFRIENPKQIKIKPIQRDISPSKIVIKKFTIDLTESNDHCKSKSIDQTVDRLLKKGEQYRKNRQKKRIKKQMREMENCSFTPKIKKYKFNNYTTKSLFSNDFNDSISMNSFQKEKGYQTIDIRQQKNRSFIEKNIKLIREKSNKVKQRRQSQSPQPSPSKVNKKSEEILRNKILGEIYKILEKMKLIKGNKKYQIFGDVELTQMDLYNIAYEMRFFTFNKKSILQKLFQKMWEEMSYNGETTVKNVSLFILAIFGIKMEDSFHLKIKQIQKNYKLFKQNYLRKKKQQTPIKPKKILSKKKKQLITRHRKKVLSQYAIYVDQGLIYPKKANLSHIDILNMENQINQIKHQQLRKKKHQKSLDECSFKPLTNKNKNQQKILKLEIKLKKQKEEIFLSDFDKIPNEIKRCKIKYKLSQKKCQKLEKLLVEQWNIFLDNQFNNEIIQFRFYNFFFAI